MSKQKKSFQINSQFDSSTIIIGNINLDFIKKELSKQITKKNIELIEEKTNEFLEILKTSQKNKFTQKEFKQIEEIVRYRIYYFIYDRIRIDFILKDKKIKSAFLLNNKSKAEFYNSYLTTYLEAIFFLPGVVYHIMDHKDRKYDKKVFIRANIIYKENSKKRYTYEQSLMKAIKQFPEYRDIQIDSEELSLLNIAYRRYRSPRKK